MSDKGIEAAIKYAKQLDEDWWRPEPILIDIRKLLEHPSVVISSGVEDGRRGITISGDEAVLEELYQKLLED